MRRRTASLGALVLTAGLALTGCGGDGASDSGDRGDGLRVTSAYMPQPVTDAMAAGYLVVENDSDRSDTLESAGSDIAEDVTIHQTSGQTMGIADSEDREVPAHGSLVLESGGMHLMFEKLKRKPEEGETVSVKLRFAEAGSVTVEMPVKSATYQPEPSTESGSASGSASDSGSSKASSSSSSSSSSHHH
ncbi:copper chaperone PCu(A)C [Streptomyces poonensis]|uniref:Copper chaperone PCu(A)C n=1 Tax=Streptomyces poonensis TaxID=68255 RepID=A0A918PVA8_9ACTN|nr:copper chaperone PCu(A)C [Streptomyces poonensis]GGZ24060.1 hypothetical protein GCM10010365_50330 [Streptomyces poonensis]GLJ89918.1 hypothetical protein GCM10017589_25190 [Streptomyces poonensis]